MARTLSDCKSVIELQNKIDILKETIIRSCPTSFDIVKNQLTRLTDLLEEEKTKLLNK